MKNSSYWTRLLKSKGVFFFCNPASWRRDVSQAMQGNGYQYQKDQLSVIQSVILLNGADWKHKSMKLRGRQEEGVILAPAATGLLLGHHSMSHTGLLGPLPSTSIPRDLSAGQEGPDTVCVCLCYPSSAHHVTWDESQVLPLNYSTLHNLTNGHHIFLLYPHSVTPASLVS